MSVLVDPSALLAEAEAALRAARSLQELIEVRARFLGKKGSVSAVLRGLADLAPGERAALGARANEVKARIEATAEACRERLERAAAADALTQGRLDVSLP